jgi:hypothetical protein
VARVIADGLLATDGLVAVVKRDCPTCETVAPVLRQLADAGLDLVVVSQDDPAFPDGFVAVDDRELDLSWALQIETVPTLVQCRDGVEQARVVGWSRVEWEALTGVGALGPGLPEHRPGCGSRTLDPELADVLAVRHGMGRLAARRVALGVHEDDIEACFARGWSDGLPVVPPTPARVLRMLAGTTRDPADVVAIVPPDLVPATVEKVAINAVLAGCRPEHLPVVLAAVEAACTDAFNIHGVLATTMSVGPVLVVNGPVARAIGMNSGVNVLGQGNRANLAIGRALQLVVRNVGGGRPGEIDRAALGHPGKITFCFAEDEAGSPWEPLAQERGVPAGRSAVTVFAGEGPRVVADQLSREPRSLARSLAANLRTIGHVKSAGGFDAMVVVGPEHARVFREAGWSKARLRDEIRAVLTIPGEELVRGAGGMAEGMAQVEPGRSYTRFAEDGLWFVHAGGGAGLFSAVIGSWARGPMGSQPVTVEVGT